MSAHLNLSTGKFLNSSTLFKLSDALLLDLSSGEIVMSNLLVPRAGVDLFKLASLDLNFAQRKSLTDRVSGNNLVTFSRASKATYVGSDGLVKTSPVNYAINSEQVNLWTLLRGSVSANFAESPIGNLTADKWIPGIATDFHYPKLTTTLSSTSSVTYSIYAKQAGYRYLLLNTPGGSASGNAGPIIDLQDGVVAGNFAATYPTTVTDAGNGWWRVTMTFTGDGFNTVVDHNPLPTSTVGAYAGDGTSGVLLWGAQLEEGTTATDYIPTGATISGAPRFDHDPVTGESLGLLIEEARTNEIQYSDDVSNSWWNKTALSTPTLVSSVNNPLQNADAYRIRANTASNASHYLHRNQSDLLGANTAYTFSALVAPEGLNTEADYGKVQLRIFQIGGTSGVVNFDLNTGQSNPQDGLSGQSSTTAAWSISDYGMEPYLNGWYRVWMTFQVTGSTCSIGIVNIDDINASDASGVHSYASNGTAGYYVAGIQVEEGSHKTSIIQTNGSTVTRAADVASITGTSFSSWYNQSEGTVFYKASAYFAGIPAALFSTGSSASLDPRINVNVISGSLGGGGRTQVNVSGIQFDTGNSSTPPYSLGTLVKQASAFQADNFAHCFQGGTVITDSSGTMPSTISRMDIGHNWVPSFINGHISRLAYFPTRKSDQELIDLTT
jgi:hypothetical protein